MKQIFYVSVAVLILSGCATTQSPSTVSKLQIQVAQLERQVSDRDRDIEDLKNEVRQLSEQIDSPISYTVEEPDLSVVSKPSSSATAKKDKAYEIINREIVRVPVEATKVQQALKNAGYYNGAIDGRLGSGSKQAIRDFQEDQGLAVDGLIGKKTWDALKTYLKE